MGNDQSSSKSGKKAAPRAQTRTEAARARAVGAIQTQKQQMGVMEKRIAFHEKKVERLRREAKAIMQAAKTPAQKKVAKRKAMQKLKQVKLYEKQILSEQKKMKYLPLINVWRFKCGRRSFAEPWIGLVKEKMRSE